MCVGDVGIKTGFGIVVGEKVDVWEDPAEDQGRQFCILWTSGRRIGAWAYCLQGR